MDQDSHEEIERLNSRLNLLESSSNQLIRQMEDHYALKMKEMESKVSDLQSGTKVTETRISIQSAGLTF